MTTRISKLPLPYPLPAPFAHELASLVLGPVTRTYLHAFAVAQILLVSWTAGHQLPLVELYRRQTPPMPLLIPEFQERAARAPDDEALFEDVLATLTAGAEMLSSAPDADGVVADLSVQLNECWTFALREFNSYPEAANALRQLVSKYTGEPCNLAIGEGAAEGAAGAGNLAQVAPGVYILDHATLSSREGKARIAQMLSSAGQQNSSPKTSVVKVLPSFDSSKPSLQVFDPAEVAALVQRMPASSHPLEGNAQQRNLLTAMSEDRGRRPLREVPIGNPLIEMYDRFPHFVDVLDLVQSSVALSGCGDDGRPVYMPPILLRGTAGTGKTYFAQELARVLELHFVERDLSVTSDAFVIVGMDSTWKNSKPGIVFDSLVHGQSANPLILLDELDKVAVTSSHNSPMQALHALLEPTSASTFTDEFISVKLDASRVNWILTANQAFIPDPIITRLEVFDIREPTKAECRQIAASVWSRICATRMPKGHGFALELEDSILDYMSQCTPRVMRKMLTLAAGKAVQDARRHVLIDDVKAAARRYVVPEKRMGFTPG
jgi:ATP-dependent Lon protease